MKIGQNEKCPCGSGKKYKRCCAVAVQQMAGKIVEQRNKQGIADFQGLSPEDMHRLLLHPFESPSILEWHFEKVENADQLSYIFLAIRLISALSSARIKATANGNLPVKLCREMIDTYYRERFPETFQHWESNVRSELDYTPLHEVRVLLENAQIITLSKSYWSWNASKSDLLSRIVLHDATAIRELYEILFKTYLLNYNWGYLGGDEKLLQKYAHTFMYSLFLLHKFGKKWVNFKEYENSYYLAFRQAFLSSFIEEEGCFGKYSEYEVQVWHRIAGYFGFVSLQNEPPDSLETKRLKLKATSTFQALIEWKS